MVRYEIATLSTTIGAAGKAGPALESWTAAGKGKLLGVFASEIGLLNQILVLRGFETEADLLSTLRPSVDGLILEWGGHRGTFLPQVWEQLPEPEDFLAHLKRKAGLRVDFWAPDVKIDRYTVQAFIDPAQGPLPEGT